MDPANFINPEQNKRMYDDQNTAMCRFLVKVQTPYILKVFDPEGEEIKLEESLNTWEHLCLFESKMNPAEHLKSKYKLQNYMEWLGKKIFLFLAKFKFGKWIMADMDNWMEGNPLLFDGKAKNRYDDEIFEGSKYDRKKKIDVKNI